MIDLTQTADLLKTDILPIPEEEILVDMLQSLLLMYKLQYTSIDKWVKALKSVPLYAVLNGFRFNSGSWSLL